MIEQLAKRWLTELEQDMQEVLEAGYEHVEQLRLATQLVEKYLKRLRLKVQEKGFSSNSEEINFFKHLKPKFYQWKIYFLERYAMERGRPAFGAVEQQSWLEREMEYVERFFFQNHFLYEYYRLNYSDLDALYFVRGADRGSMLLPEVPELDKDFSTEGDYLFAKFMAFEKLRGLLLEEINGASRDAGEKILSRKGKRLIWTGDSTNLIELLYGLYEAKQFNDGKADIADLVDVFSQMFHVNLSNYFQRFAKIKQRKLVSKTKFLDEMVLAVAKRIDDSDAYVPSWAK